MTVKINDFAKAYQIAILQDGTNVTMTEAREDCHALIDVIKENLLLGNHIKFHGIGALIIRKRNKRTTKLPSGDEASVAACISCSMVKVIKKDASNLIGNKKLNSKQIRDKLSLLLGDDNKSIILFSVFKRFLLCVKTGRYGDFYIHNFGRFMHKPCGKNDCVKFKVSTRFKMSLQKTG